MANSITLWLFKDPSINISLFLIDRITIMLALNALVLKLDNTKLMNDVVASPGSIIFLSFNLFHMVIRTLAYLEERTKVNRENKTGKANEGEPNEEVENCEEMEDVEDREDLLGRNETNDVKANETEEEDDDVCLELNEMQDVEPNETVKEMGVAQMMQILLLFFTAVAVVNGYIMGSLKILMVVYAYGVIVTATITIPCWSFFNLQAFNWLDQSEAKKHPMPQEQGLVRLAEIETCKREVDNEIHDGKTNKETDEFSVLQEKMDEELKLMLVNKLEVINESFQTLEEILEIPQKDEGQTEKDNEKIEEADPLVIKEYQYIMILEKKIKRLVTFMEIEAVKSMEEWEKCEKEKRDFLAKLAAETASSQIYQSCKNKVQGIRGNTIDGVEEALKNLQQDDDWEVVAAK